LTEPGSATLAAAAFVALGGRFLRRPEALAEAMRGVRVLAFDWDGVLGSGAKAGGIDSPFDEADSMGVNLLRYALARRAGGAPVCAILSGASADSAEAFGRRERFHRVYRGARIKHLAFERLLADLGGIDPRTVAYFFDDVNDLAIARRCGVRVLVRRAASPLFADHAIATAAVDYVTALDARANAVREACEMLLGVCGDADATFASRAASDADYEAYFAARQTIVPTLVDLD
jgi:3-deoxy-D-manno-octulosonate 8-phosphate phosphatase (KDO 8-P phosphatase)